MTLDQMLDTYPADVRERILAQVKKTIGYAKADLPHLIAEEFGNAGLRSADLGAMKALIASTAETVAKEVVGMLGVYYTRELTQASDNMMRGTLAGIAIGKGAEEFGQALMDTVKPPSWCAAAGEGDQG